MSTRNRPVLLADEVQEALRSLAHATRHLDDPTEVYGILGELTNGLASLAQSLHQIGDFHEGSARNRAWVGDDLRAGRASSYQVAWDLHRAAEMLHQVKAAVDHAHEIEATITYDLNGAPPPLTPVARPTSEPRLSL